MRLYVVRPLVVRPSEWRPTIKYREGLKKKLRDVLQEREVASFNYFKVFIHVSSDITGVTMVFHWVVL